MCFLDSVYKTFVISTIVDIIKSKERYLVYKTFVISTIVDMGKYPLSLKSIKHL